VHTETTIALSTFGGGDGQPYDRALIDTERALYLVDSDGSRDTIDVARFLATADAHDAEALSDARGPVLDLGCGPGRLVRAAILRGHLALGIDASTVAVRIAQNQGLPVLCRSIFQSLPAEGTWGTAMLIDGNIGIGGDPLRLLRRCVQLVMGGGHGRVLVETHPDSSRDRTFEATVVDDLGRSSLPFPWAEVGIHALHAHATRAGLAFVRTWMRGDRTFVEYASV
jgi:SAM-dependent methyltransferase